MRSIVAGVLATVTVLGLLTSCGSDAKLTLPADSTVDATGDSTPSSGVVSPQEGTIPEISLPDGATIPAGGLPADVSIPEAAIDQMIAQFEAAGMKVDKECFKSLLGDESLRKMVEAGGTPNQDAIKKFFTCLAT